MKIPTSYIKNIANNLNFDNLLLQKVNSNLYLSLEEIELLKLYKIPYEQCASLKEVILLIEDIIDNGSSDSEDLDYLSQVLSERDYYFYTKK